MDIEMDNFQDFGGLWTSDESGFRHIDNYYQTHNISIARITSSDKKELHCSNLTNKKQANSNYSYNKSEVFEVCKDSIDDSYDSNNNIRYYSRFPIIHGLNKSYLYPNRSNIMLKEIF